MRGTTVKHAIKRMDRLLSNGQMQGEREPIQAALEQKKVTGANLYHRQGRPMSCVTVSPATLSMDTHQFEQWFSTHFSRPLWISRTCTDNPTLQVMNDKFLVSQACQLIICEG